MLLRRPLLPLLVQGSWPIIARVKSARPCYLASVKARLPDRIQLPLTFEPHLLVRDLQRLASFDWIKHFVRQNYEGDWSVIPLRGKAGARQPVMMIYSDPTATEFEDTPMLQG